MSSSKLEVPEDIRLADSRVREACKLPLTIWLLLDFGSYMSALARLSGDDKRSEFVVGSSNEDASESVVSIGRNVCAVLFREIHPPNRLHSLTSIVIPGRTGSSPMQRIGWRGIRVIEERHASAFNKISWWSSMEFGCLVTSDSACYGFQTFLLELNIPKRLHKLNMVTHSINGVVTGFEGIVEIEATVVI
uniref:Uncharacterized protein n=1 Tax=Chromera velia CCMP2878 TaxID=1169474 RepID=A0A0G4I4X5_9ALVE|eukprot:Cvel_1834.t1-p1 / transcript=Cvel_1834.t1 / gene=Cvel_1834 / organism=Chromera_velia_CCMP2878 / gene_product=hypothetical protein / transcript_product=hypothetical protein / location=Cvel_scaffold67:130761-131820(+) / protein_length=190 / sequence_SO=supercontig / SO=protein_coding / is_pseudo=false